MKYVIILGDGMSDEPIAELGGKTPLDCAKTPMIDSLAKESEIGLVQTIPEGMKPGSDTANLSVLGYDPREYYTGRSPLEALSIGVTMKDTDIAVRCNLVTLSEEDVPYEEKVMIDHSASEITTAEAVVLLEAIKAELETDIFHYYSGTSYRHLLIWNKGEVVDSIGPHDILGQTICSYFPKSVDLEKMMKKSYEILKNHPVNIDRKAKGLHPANSIWFWGAGTKPHLSSFEEKNRKRGVMISAVDLLKGIATGVGMTNIQVDGADGTLHTNYEGKADAAVKALIEEGYDFAYIHVEAPDEMGHQGSVERKIQAIEYLDDRVIRIVKRELDHSGEAYRMLILPDHATPICVRTHTSDPVPYLLYDSMKTITRSSCYSYNEKEAKASGRMIADGYKMIDYLFSH